MMDCPPKSPDLNPIEQIWGELENKLDRSIVHSKECLWFELQKAWDNISVEVLRKYIDTMPERCCNCCKRWTYQILKLKVDKNSTTHFI
uniref:Tc1-like transposase DDE domain-containing protein n=1 Tax=Sinocyclocheilus rhinocerous TaxID=307959 RepID=A0A673GJ32_9TELE